MIRREIEVQDGTKLWLLVSQVAHAHVSGELARYWQDEFTPDVVDAIAHHDDGWAAWEAEPKMNPEYGRPYSFLEMPLADALSIWDNSIAAAHKFGPLAGYIVAGHFYNLLSESDHAQEGLAIAWLTAKRKVRTAWIDQWLRADPTHTLDDAKRAQQMLLIADLFSLWLCCDCPVEENHESILGNSAMKLRTNKLHGQFRFSVPDFAFRQRSSTDTGERLDWTVAVDPFPFKDSTLSLSAMSVAAPVSRYATWQGLMAVSRPVELRWQLVPAVRPSDSAS